MKPVISILSEQLANKIAAGEVVQRPANAVKELLENAIDAGARTITLRVEGGGKTLIHCIDDGSGMVEEDAALAFRRHATSKIHTYDDLENIRTLGFRGEALASIGAVAQVELRSRVAEEEVGTLVRVEGGTLKEQSKCPAPVGTSILVKNLFFNTPGRRNFQKSESTEFRHVSDVVQRIALSHPSIGIRFLSGSETIFDLRASEQNERIKDLFGDKLASSLIPVRQESELMKIDGYVGTPDFARKSRIEQFLFLNGRFIINRNIGHAVYQSYEHLLEKGSFPFYVLFLTIDPKRVDVNVHPTKMEVKFEDDVGIHRQVASAIRSTLSANNLVPSIGLREAGLKEFDAGLRFTGEAGGVDVRELLRPPRSGDPSTLPATSPPVQDSIIGAEDRHVWQLHNKYILTVIEEGLMVIDQHAAHERVIYERTIARFTEHQTQSQQLLFPHTIDLLPADAALVKQLQADLERIGFSLKFFGASTVILDGVPVDVRPGEESRILQNVIDLYKRDESGLVLEPRERLAKSYSCRAAIKKGDPLSGSEMRTLIHQLMKTEIPFVCPHGRPVIVKLPLGELDRRFGRTS